MIHFNLPVFKAVLKNVFLKKKNSVKILNGVSLQQLIKLRVLIPSMEKGLPYGILFQRKKGKILGNQNGNSACDFYNRFEQDLQLMRFLNIPNFRFSISWSRIFS